MTTLQRTPPGAYSLTNTYRPKKVSNRKPPPQPTLPNTSLDALRKNGAGSKFISAIISIATHYEGGVTKVVTDAVLSKWLQPESKPERFRSKMIYELHNMHHYAIADLSRFLNMHKQTIREILRKQKGKWGGRQ